MASCLPSTCCCLNRQVKNGTEQNNKTVNLLMPLERDTKQQNVALLSMEAATKKGKFRMVLNHRKETSYYSNEL